MEILLRPDHGVFQLASPHADRGQLPVDGVRRAGARSTKGPCQSCRLLLDGPEGPFKARQPLLKLGSPSLEQEVGLPREPVQCRGSLMGQAAERSAELYTTRSAAKIWAMPDWNSVPFPELDAAQLSEICAKYGLGQRRIGRMPSTGVVNSIYTLGHDLVLRIPKNMPEALSDTYTESVACPVAHAAGVRTPALVVWDESFDILDVPYTIHELVDGEPSELDFDGPVWRALGRDVARMHAVVTECPDPLGRLDDAGRADQKRILEWANGTEVQGWLERCIDRMRPLIADIVPDKFLHGDVSNNNVLHKDGEYAALIDWGDAAWGDPSLEFASLPMVAVMPMLAGYREVLPLDPVTTEARILWDKLVRIDRPVILEHLLAFRSRAPEPWRGLLE